MQDPEAAAAAGPWRIGKKSGIDAHPRRQLGVAGRCDAGRSAADHGGRRGRALRLDRVTTRAREPFPRGTRGLLRRRRVARR